MKSTYRVMGRGTLSDEAQLRAIKRFQRQLAILLKMETAEREIKPTPRLVDQIEWGFEVPDTAHFTVREADILGGVCMITFSTNDRTDPGTRFLPV
jgi:hypothetical protein